MAAPVTAENPLRQGMRLARTPEPCTTVIFGASGDLTRRKLMPALYNLALQQWLPAGFSVVGFARRADTDDVFRHHMKEAVDTFSRQTPGGRVSLPEDCANLVCFLCSAEGGWVNGQLLYSNGGFR